MAEQGGAELGNHLWRGGERIEVAKVPDRFTARLKAGVRPSEVERVSRADHRNSLARANLDVFAVDATARDAAMERLRQGDEIEFASHVYTLEGDPTSRVYLSDELTVQFKAGVADDEIERLAGEVGLELIKAVEGVPRAYV